MTITPRSSLCALGGAVSVMFCLAGSASADPLPVRVGACAATTIKQVATRLENTPGSGSAISYDNGGYQVSYDTIAAIDASHPGDSVSLCLVSIPQNCPAGDSRGRIYRATNSRTHGVWTEPDSEHSCGGA